MGVSIAQGGRKSQRCGNPLVLLIFQVFLAGGVQAYNLAVNVDDDSEAEHTQPGPGVLRESMFEQDIYMPVNILDGCVNHGLGEQVIFAQHGQHPLGYQFPVGKDLLAEQLNDLAVHRLGLNVTPEAIIQDDVMWDRADVNYLGRFVLFAEDQTSK
jgi:hypothetical protein